MFTDRLEKLRQERKLTKKEIADELGIPYSTYFGYSNGTREPSIKMLWLLADFFNVSVDYLLGLSNSQNNVTSDSFSVDEVNTIKKYRALDEHGKELVDTILDKEYSRMKQPDKDDNEEEDQEWRKYLGTPIAARGGMIYADEEFAKATYRIEQYNRERKKLKEQKKED